MEQTGKGSWERKKRTKQQSEATERKINAASLLLSLVLIAGRSLSASFSCCALPSTLYSQCQALSLSLSISRFVSQYFLIVSSALAQARVPAGASHSRQLPCLLCGHRHPCPPMPKSTMQRHMGLRRAHGRRLALQPARRGPHRNPPSRASGNAHPAFGCSSQCQPPASLRPPPGWYRLSQIARHRTLGVCIPPSQTGPGRGLGIGPGAGRAGAGRNLIWWGRARAG